MTSSSLLRVHGYDSVIEGRVHVCHVTQIYPTLLSPTFALKAQKSPFRFKVFVSAAKKVASPCTTTGIYWPLVSQSFSFPEDRTARTGVKKGRPSDPPGPPSSPDPSGPPWDWMMFSKPHMNQLPSWRFQVDFLPRDHSCPVPW